MLKSIGALCICFFLFAGAAKADPVQQGPSPAGKLPEKIIRQDKRALFLSLRSSLQASAAAWQRQDVQTAWDLDKSCALTAYEELDPNSPITDPQTIYTLLALRANSLQILSSDGTLRPSVSIVRTTLLRASGDMRVVVLRRLLKNKAGKIKALASLPRYTESLCVFFDDWRAAGSPDLAEYADLSDYKAQFALVSGLVSDDPYSANIDSGLYDLYMPDNSIGNEQTEVIWKYVGWIATSFPYSQSLRANYDFWFEASGSLEEF